MSPPDKVPFPSSLQDLVASRLLLYGRSTEANVGSSKDQPILDQVDTSVEIPLISKQLNLGNYVMNEKKRREISGWTIMLTCIGAFLHTYSVSSLGLPSLLRLTLCGVSGVLLLLGLIVLTCIDQDDARHNFGHTGGFICPFVPLLPIACFLINVYLLINLELLRGCEFRYG